MLKNSPVMVTVPCHDLEASRRFYEDVLGLIAKDVEVPGAKLYEVGHSEIIFLYETQSAGGDATRLSFLCDDLDSEVTTLRSRGVTFEEYDYPELKTVNGIAVVPGGMKSAWFKDIDGNVLNIAENIVVE